MQFQLRHDPLKTLPDQDIPEDIKVSQRYLV